MSTPISAAVGRVMADPALPANPQRDMHPAVTARSARANLDAALSRIQQFGVTCTVKMETVFPEGMNGEATFRQKASSLTVITASSADLRAALSVIQEAMYPASVEQIEQWLAAVAVKTGRRRETSNESDLALSVYTAHLREYPGDAVREVLHAYRGQWFPTWGELADRLDEFVEPRVMIRDRLMDMIDGGTRSKQMALPHDPHAERLQQLRDELAAADRVATTYPDLADSTERKRAAIAAEISKLERT